MSHKGSGKGWKVVGWVFVVLPSMALLNRVLTGMRGQATQEFLAGNRQLWPEVLGVNCGFALWAVIPFACGLMLRRKGRRDEGRGLMIAAAVIWAGLVLTEFFVFPERYRLPTAG